jgi:hypothetical protein
MYSEVSYQHDAYRLLIYQRTGSGESAVDPLTQLADLFLLLTYQTRDIGKCLGKCTNCRKEPQCLLSTWFLSTSDTIMSVIFTIKTGRDWARRC